VAVVALLSTLCIPVSFSAELESSSVKEVAIVLSRYKEAIDKRDFRIKAPSSVPPADKVDISIQNMHEAFSAFADVFEKTWGNEKMEGIQLNQLRVHPLSYLSNYTYSNIRVEGDSAYADIELTVNGEVRKYVQYLAKLNGQWYIAQKTGPPEYSQSDRDKLLAFAELIQQLADFVNGISSRIVSGDISQAASVEAIREKLAYFEEQRELLSSTGAR
jgi:hypothetical protein